MINNNLIQGYHTYNCNDTNFQVTRDDGKLASCVETAKKIANISRNYQREFGLSWILFYMADFISLLPLGKRVQYWVLKNSILNDYNKWAENWNKTLKENYFCPFKTVDHIEDAQVICLGEFHHLTKLQHNNAELCEGFSKSGEVILEECTEGLAKQLTKKNENLQLAFYPKGVLRKGWDLAKNKEKQSILDRTSMSISFILSGITLSSLIYFGYLKASDQYSKSIGPLGILAGTVGLYYLKKNQDKRVILERNRNMYPAIEKSLIGTNKCFIIAGAAHLAAPTKATSYNKKAIGELHDYLKNKKAIVLINKHPVIQLFFKT